MLGKKVVLLSPARIIGGRSKKEKGLICEHQPPLILAEQPAILMAVPDAATLPDTAPKTASHPSHLGDEDQKLMLLIIEDHPEGYNTRHF